MVGIGAKRTGIVPAHVLDWVQMLMPTDLYFNIEEIIILWTITTQSGNAGEYVV